MNKFIIFALIALSASSVSAQGWFAINAWSGLGDGNSEAIIPTDSEESKYLKPNEQAFSSFCVQARDDVKSFLTSGANQAAASLFAAFFKGIGESGDQLLHVQQSAVDEAAKAIREQVSPAENVEEKVEKLSLIQNVSKGAKFVLNTVVSTAKSELASRIALVKSQFNTSNLKEQLTDLCDSVSKDLKRDLTKKLNDFKGTAKSAAAAAGADASAVDAVTIENLGCLTTGRVNKVAQVCNFISFAGPALLPVLGLA